MPAAPLLCFGPYRLEGANGQLWWHAQLVLLPPKAAAVLWCLATQAGQLVTRAHLFETVWAGTVVSDAVLTVCIHELRRALGDEAQQPRYIATVHRRGYRFIAPVITAPQVGGTHRMGRQPPVASGASPRSPQPSVLSTVSFAGREAEVAEIQACLARARGGQRQVLFVTGEAGIGKTALVEACVATLGAQEAVWMSWGQCVDTYGPGTGYFPVLEALGRLCQGPAGSTVLGQIRQWAPSWLAQQAGLLRRTRGVTRAHLLRELAEALEALTASQLGVVVLEDLHWSDPSTVEALTMLARRQEAGGLAAWPDGTVSGHYRFRHLDGTWGILARLAAGHVGPGRGGYGANAPEPVGRLGHGKHTGKAALSGLAG